MDKEASIMAAASKELSSQFRALIDTDDIETLKQQQMLILGRLQDSNAVLSHFNDFSENCFSEVSSDLARSTRVLKSMKPDLDYIFQKLRSIKGRILATYPDAFPDESSREELDRRPDLELPQ
uniref:KxDL domain-containing protein n=1 Tax=Kalanchoe fedtschenkoi TaxID=63787 RepID=A0A7N1A556_KALFE